MREKLARFMAGRNGTDALARFVSVVTCVLLVAALIIGGNVSNVLWIFSVAGLVYSYFRIFSKNVYKRRLENERFLMKRNEVFGYFRGCRERWSQRKEYKFFRCPACRTMLRVPRGKGKIKVVCRKCGNSFIKKT